MDTLHDKEYKTSKAVNNVKVNEIIAWQFSYSMHKGSPNSTGLKGGSTGMKAFNTLLKIHSTLLQSRFMQMLYFCNCDKERYQLYALHKNEV